GSHGTAAGERIAGPYLACKADFEQPHLACAGELGQASREASGGPHSLGKNGGNTGRLDEGLIVMQRHEITRRSRITDKVRACDIFDFDRRNGVADLYCFEFQFRYHGSLSSDGLFENLNFSPCNFPSAIGIDIQPPTA